MFDLVGYYVDILARQLDREGWRLGDPFDCHARFSLTAVSSLVAHEPPTRS